MSKSLVEQIREMVDVSIDREWHPTSCCECIIGRSCITQYDERELFSTIADRIESEYMELPMDADGVPIKPGDKVYIVGRYEWLDVLGIGDGDFPIYTGRKDGTSTEAWMQPSDITHKQPDSLGRIEADAMKKVGDYWGCNVANCSDCPAKVDGKRPMERYGVANCVRAMYHDLLRRQREVLERGQE